MNVLNYFIILPICHDWCFNTVQTIFEKAVRFMFLLWCSFGQLCNFFIRSIPLDNNRTVATHPCPRNLQPTGVWSGVGTEGRPNLWEYMYIHSDCHQKVLPLKYQLLCTSEVWGTQGTLRNYFTDKQSPARAVCLTKVNDVDFLSVLSRSTFDWAWEFRHEVRVIK